MFPGVKEQLDIIRHRTVEIIPEDELVKKLERSVKTGKQLVVKLGCDPSRPDLHIGHSVVLQKLRDFQDIGHKAVLIIGDFTAMIGDPSGKSNTRPPLSIEETRIHGQTYFDQASKVLSKKNLEIRYNSEWLDKITFKDLIDITSNFSVQQLIERDMFQERLKNAKPIHLHEFLYPVAQGYDSVYMKLIKRTPVRDQRARLESLLLAEKFRYPKDDWRARALDYIL